MSQWLLQDERKLDKKASLICLPYAGGTSSSFMHWGKKMPDYLELSVAELPGRNQRFSEPFVSDIDLVVEFLYQSLKTLGEAPVFIFGHSMGSLLAYKLCLRCYQNLQDIPIIGLIVSGKIAPHMVVRERKIHNICAQEFKETVVKYDGIPTEVLENKELFDVLEPRLRADFKLSENYKSTDAIEQVSCSIMAMAGTLDYNASPEKVAQWKQYTSNYFFLKTFIGGHFFIKQKEEAVVREIVGFISKQMLKHNVL